MGVDFSPTFCYISYAVLGTHGGIAQLARAFGSYPECPRFKSRCRYQIRRSDPLRLLYGPLVKWLRHRPFTAVTWVRVPYGSPKQSSPPQGGLFCFAYHSRGTRTERCQETCRGHVFPRGGDGKGASAVICPILSLFLEKPLKIRYTIKKVSCVPGRSCPRQPAGRIRSHQQREL